MKLTIFALLACLIAYACNNKPGAVAKTQNNQSTSYTVPDDSAITKAVHDTYASIGFDNNNPQYDNIPLHFIPQAHLISFRTDTAHVMSITEYITSYRQFMETNKIKMFHEEEAYGKTEQFGRIAQRISTYVMYLNTRDSAAHRGVNSFQLIKAPSGWKVTSIIWDVEKPSLPIPPYYLK